MSQSHYSLRWNNHQSHILSAFDALLQAETLVDVTLVCAESSVRAHKVVLSACSPFFQRIFAENPCKHPVIVLKDFSGWEVQAIVDFMYKGEIAVVQEQLQSLIKAAESLQVRGLVNQEDVTNVPASPSPRDADEERSVNESPADFGATTAHETPAAGWMLDALHERAESPLPRRKQARPRRRSGEIMAPQDLTTCAKTTSSPERPFHVQPPQTHVENLSLKRPKLDAAVKDALHSGGFGYSTKDKDKENHRLLAEEKKNKMTFQGQFIQQSLLPLQQHHQQQQEEEERAKMVLTPDPSGSPELDLSMHHHKEFPPSPPLLPPSMLSMKHEMDGHSPLPFPPMPSVSALSMTPPHSKFFGLDSPLLFPPGLNGCRNPLLELADPRTTPDTHMFTKKKMGRPKGQHSAPRGGPPRSWTNAELTEALQHVWNKKMTTSQASRIFGIPYNSLLMYVRGKYGKSLKLEQLRKDCIGGPGGMDLLNLSAPGGGAGTNNNNIVKNDPEDQRPSSAEHAPPGGQHPMFNPFAPNFYPDFAAAAGGFPIPVSMIHLLPQSAKNRDHYMSGSHDRGDRGGGGGSGSNGNDLEDCNRNERSLKEEPQDMFLPPGLSREDRRELVQQNGQD